MNKSLNNVCENTHPSPPSLLPPPPPAAKPVEWSDENSSRHENRNRITKQSTNEAKRQMKNLGSQKETSGVSLIDRERIWKKEH